MSTFRPFVLRRTVPFLSKLEVASLLIYPSTDKTAVGDSARAFIRYNVKEDKTVNTPTGPRGAIEHVAGRVVGYVKGGVFEKILGGGGVLVPVPRHGLLRPGDLWPAQRICEELRRVGIGESTERCVERVTVVKRSSTAKPGERPSVREHYDSLRVKPLLVVPKRIVLVDDVVTRGATLIAAGSRLEEQFPGVELVAFTYARIERDCTLATLAEMLSPKVESIEYQAGWEAPFRG